jgi:hypothetical protein
LSELHTITTETNNNRTVGEGAGALALETSLDPFGSQMMGEFRPGKMIPMLTGGPTWTGTGNIQDHDDGDSDFYSPN